MSLPGSALFVSVSSGRLYPNPPSPSKPSTWECLESAAQDHFHLQVATWGRLETVEVLGEG